MGASVLSLAGVGFAAAGRIGDVLPPFGFTVFTIAAALLLTLVAFVVGGKSRQFNLTVAAETLVAFGIFSLVVGLGCAILLALSRFQSADTIKMDDLGAVTTVFIEGLFTAAVCPMLAMLIRIRDAQLRVAEAGGAEMDGAARAADALASQLKAMTATLTALNTALVEEVKTFRTAAAEVGAAARVMADDLFKGSKQAKEALQQVERGATSLGGTAEKAATATGRFGTELSGLTKSASDTKALLDALSKAVESVERFIKGGAAST
jgi:hypothetical protein